MKVKILLLLGFIWLLPGLNELYSQDSLVTEVNKEQKIDELIDSHVQDIPELNEKVSISLSDVGIQEFIRGIAHEANLNVNINIDPSFKITVTNNFNNVKARDIIVFLCREYDLKVSFIGNIITIYKEVEQKKLEPPKISIYYNEDTKIITLDYQDALLSAVAKEITKVTGKNIVLSPGIGNNKVSGYVKEKPFDLAIEKFAFANNLKSKITDDQFYILKQNITETKQGSSPYSSKNSIQKVKIIDPDSYELKINIYKDTISIHAVNAPIEETIKQVSNKMGINYFITTEIEGQQTCNSKKLSYDKFLENILNGTNYTFKNNDGIYLIGKKDISELKEFRIIHLQHRSVDTISSIILDDIKGDATIKEFPELNSLLVSGTVSQLDKIEAFIYEIDKSVPVILIEVLIVDYVKHHRVETGISMGINNNNTGGTSVKQVLPSVEYDMNPSTINSLINSFNGFGWFKLGKVSSSFYASIDALEANGIIELKSTPRLSTLNGHMAKLIKGVQTFYKEEQSTLQGSITPYQSNFTRYVPIEANLEISITPIVSGDEQITMKIKIEQSDFNFINPEGPPNKEKRQFESLIRIKNQEMILLGGLENINNVDTGEGVPILSRIPIIKWFFSKKVKEKYHSKLNFFIKPTIIN